MGGPPGGMLGGGPWVMSGDIMPGGPGKRTGASPGAPWEEVVPVWPCVVLGV